MGPVFYVMAILGCGDAEAACQPVRIEPARYASQDACLAASAALLGASGDLDFPTVTAQCRKGDQQMADATMATRR